MAAALKLSNLTKEVYVCTDGIIYEMPSYVKVVVGVTSLLSIIGALLIVLSYVCFKSTRSKAREIVLNLSLMDCLVASANLIGIVTPSDSLSSSAHWLCMTQAIIAMYGTLSSILWTNSLAVYFYTTVVLDSDKLQRHCVYLAYVISYGLSLMMTVWFIATHRLGYNPKSYSELCSLKDSEGSETFLALSIMFGYDMWIYITIILIPTISVALISYMRLAHRNLRSVLPLTLNEHLPSQMFLSAIHGLERELLAVPFVFVLLRVWSLLLDILMEIGLRIPCWLFHILATGAGIGDCGQGFFNAIIFCVLSKEVRKAFADAFFNVISSKRKPLRIATAIA